jgi:uncharacterized protein (TIGR00369 family)
MAEGPVQQAIEPKNPEYQARTLRFAEAHAFAAHLGIELTKCEPGRVEVEMEPTEFHQNARRYIHTGVVLAIGEFAATLATLTLLGADEHGEHLELKVDFVRPPRGERLIARGKVVDAGRRLTAAEAEVFVAMGPREALVAKLSTLQQVAPGGD